MFYFFLLPNVASLRSVLFDCLFFRVGRPLVDDWNGVEQKSVAAWLTGFSTSKEIIKSWKMKTKVRKNEQHL